MRNIHIMVSIERKLLITFLRAALRPLVKFSLRHSLKVQEVSECLKEIFLECAKTQLNSKGEKVTDSRLSVMTGLHRKDIARLSQGGPSMEAKSLIARVIGQWQTDSRYLSKGKKPRVLTADEEFYDLVGSVSKELNPSTVLFELERVGAVTRHGEKVKLMSDAYTPKGDVEAALRIFSSDSNDLIGCVEENLFKRLPISNMHLHTEYDRIRPEAAQNIRRFLLKEGHAMHERFRKFISKFDQDINPDPKFEGEGIKVVVGSFSKVYENGREDV